MNSDNQRRNSFSNFVKSLLLLVTTPTNQECEQEQKETYHSNFYDLYYSFPAFDDELEQDSSTCSQSHNNTTTSYISTNHILC